MTNMINEYMDRIENENERLLKQIEQAVPAMREFARKNPPHNYNGIAQDPCGVHQWLREIEILEIDTQ